MSRMSLFPLLSSLFVLGIFASPGVAWADEKAEAKAILDATGVRGGLVVHVGCGDGKLTAALRASDSYIVQGLDDDGANVEKARTYIRSLGIYGKVTAGKLAGERLPYIDNLVNLVVSENIGKVPMDEVMRVLAPGGVAYVKKDGAWTMAAPVRKPRPKEIDEWTHYLHDASGNAVAHDSVVGPPRHLQWVGSPAWARHHDHMASTSACVSTGGRIFYIFDEGPTDWVQLPSKWFLIARDAFNGAVLWKRPISSWYPAMFPFKSGPAQPPRRLVAVGDRVYVTLGLNDPLVALDAATGQTVRTYESTKAAEEVIFSDGVLFVLVTDAPVDWATFQQTSNNIGKEKAKVAKDWSWNEKPRQLMAVKADSGDVIWKKEYKVAPLTLAADGEHVYFHDGDKIVCLDRKDGSETWKSDIVAARSSVPVFFGSTLVVYEDVVLFFGGTRTTTALSAKTGKELWTAPHPPSGHSSPEDLLVVGGLAWSGATALTKDSGVFTGRDVHTGEVKAEFPPDVQTYWFHHRCYRSKATDKYLLPSRSGIEFVDVQAKRWTINHWTRGGCIYGIMPCNGLVYTPPHDCACYIESKTNGFCALAPESKARQLPPKIPDEGRLEQGPAYENVSADEAAGKEDWPTLRHDAARSGATASAVPAELTQAWQADVGGRLTSPVLAAGKVYVASIDAHTVHALAADKGKPLWTFTAGGRVDSPPTVYDGRVIFGSADGWVYCLRASDGALAWRFRAAPAHQQLMSYERLESVWPVHGSVLVLNGEVHCVAGRSMFLDGGLRYLRLDARTGRKLSETVMDDSDPETSKDLQAKITGLNMPTALPDVLASDGKSVFMRSQQFDLAGKRRQIVPGGIKAPEEIPPHLYSPVGFLDGNWFHRAYWVFGRGFDSGPGGWPRAGLAQPSGNLLAADETAVYGYGRKPNYYIWTTPVEYQLFSASKEVRKDVVVPTSGMAQPDPNAPEGTSIKRPSAVNYNWTADVPVAVRAMAVAGKTMFVAGPPMLVNEMEAFRKQGDPRIAAKLAEQAGALLGEKGSPGGVLWAVSTEDGKKLSELKLDSPPVFDGMIAANGRLVICTKDGKVVCLSGK
ncbi:MAG: PQQ-binding-like beta-propeller repeat protein [Phycisphaerae bacterium]